MTTVTQSFSNYGLVDPLLKTIQQMGFNEPTIVQNKCIPIILEGRDVIGEAKTGSGKTAAFGLPIINTLFLEKRKKPLQCLVLTPTRELCQQVTTHLQTIAQFTKIKVASIYGGVSYRPQIEACEETEIIVATPGRFIDIMKQGFISFANLEFLVIDEADKMFDMGFRDDIAFIAEQCPKKRKTLLFSATIPNEMLQFMQHYQNDAQIVRVDSVIGKKLLKESLSIAPTHKVKLKFLIHLLTKTASNSPAETTKALVFCRTRQDVIRLNGQLHRYGMAGVAMIHGGVSQAERTKVIYNFDHDKISVLIATDVASRGLDINDITLVVNYCVPQTQEDYIHRIGRTARAGKTGHAWSILTQYEYAQFTEVVGFRMRNIYEYDMPDLSSIIVHTEGDQDKRHAGHHNYERYSESRERSQDYRSRRRRYN